MLVYQRVNHQALSQPRLRSHLDLQLLRQHLQFHLIEKSILADWMMIMAIYNNPGEKNLVTDGHGKCIYIYIHATNNPRENRIYVNYNGKFIIMITTIL